MVLKDVEYGALQNGLDGANTMISNTVRSYRISSHLSPPAGGLRGGKDWAQENQSPTAGTSHRAH